MQTLLLLLLCIASATSSINTPPTTNLRHKRIHPRRNLGWFDDAKDWTKSKWDSINISQLAQLTKEQWNSIPFDTIKEWTLDQLKAVPLDTIKEWSREQLQSFSTQQLGDLTVEQWGQVGYDKMTDFSSEQWSKVPKENIATFTKEQTAALISTGKTMFATTSLWTKTQWEALNIDAIKDFAFEQVAALPLNSIKSFTNKQIAAIPWDSLPALTKEQWDALPIDRIAALSWEALQQLPTDKMGTITQQVWNSIPVDKMIRLGGEQLSKIPPNIVAASASKFWDSIPMYQISQLTVGMFQAMCADVNNDACAHVQTWNVEKIASITASAWKNVPVELMISFTIKQLQAINYAAVGNFTKIMWDQLPFESIIQMTGRQIREIPPEVVGEWTASQWKQIPIDDYLYLTVEQIQNIPVETLSAMSLDTISHFNGMLEVSLTDKQKEIMTEEQKIIMAATFEQAKNVQHYLNLKKTEWEARDVLNQTTIELEEGNAMAGMDNEKLLVLKNKQQTAKEDYEAAEANTQEAKKDILILDVNEKGETNNAHVGMIIGVSCLGFLVFGGIFAAVVFNSKKSTKQTVSNKSAVATSTKKETSEETMMGRKTRLEMMMKTGGFTRM